ncbi:MAG: choline dehydrogenase [Gammaproteobacteria bacterium]|jgi:choline dehydrogenase
MQDLGEFDYIIVGGGSAGCVLANRLSADPAHRVALVEAGGEDDYLWIHIPIGYLYTMNNPRTDWCFETEAQAGLNGRALNYPRGRVLGGCSAINGMIYMRGQANDYDHWRQLGNTGWGWDDIVPYFKQVEDHFLGGDDMHGAGGEWRVENPRVAWPLLDAVRDAAAEAGIPKVDDFNRGDNEGSAYFQVNQRSGRRWNAAQAFLHPIRKRPNLTVFTKAQARRVTFDGRRANGLEVRLLEGVGHLRARREVILSAGSIGSPHLLQLSGVGPGNVLRELGIAPVHALPGVGENLQDHLQLRLIYKVSNIKTLNERANRWWGKLGMGLEYALLRRGPMTMAPSQLGAFAKSDPSRETANLQYHIQPLSLDKFGEPLHDFPAFTASVCNLRPDSRGFVRAGSPDPNDKPRIQPNYLQALSDQQVAADSIRLTRRICASPALAQFSPEEFLPGPSFDSQEQLVQAAGNVGTTIFHPVGTAKMGSDENAVVSERLSVHGIEGLRVVDASVMPTVTSGNTNSPTIMIAEKGAAMIIEDQRV